MSQARNLVEFMDRKRKNEDKRGMFSDDVYYFSQKRKAFPVAGSQFLSEQYTEDLYAYECLEMMMIMKIVKKK